MRPSSKSRQPLRYLMIFALALLTACGPKASYQIEGLGQDPVLEKEVLGFLKNRASLIETDANGNGEYETFQASQIRSDLVAKMHELGYYDAQVTFQPGEKPWTGTYAIDQGTAYIIKQVRVQPKAYAHHKPKGLEGQILNAQEVLAEQEKMRAAIARDGCYYNLSLTHEVTIDTRNHTAEIIFTVDAGVQVRMGEAIFEGNGAVRDVYLQKLVGWKEGDCFDAERIETLRSRLFESGLFSGAELDLPKAPKAGSSVPITLRVRERSFRTLSAGASYYTDEGFGVTLGWRHRNLFGEAETLESRLSLSQRLQVLDGRFSKPFFIRDDQTLSFNAALSNEETDGYTTTGLETGVGLRRFFTRRLSGSTGMALSMMRIDDKAVAEKKNHYLVSLPQTLRFDDRDNALDATKGFVVEGRVEPFFDMGGESSAFWRTEASASAYHTMGKKVTAAARVKAGSLLGPATLDIPASRRYYAGGGGSVRGFGYQDVGPSINGEPQGGRSLIEGSAELRFRLSESLGAVAFVDAGSVSEDSFPELNDLSVGAGLGLRYYTDFGPLRLDVAVPVNHKETTSSSYQVYISIGQAF